MAKLQHEIAGKPVRTANRKIEIRITPNDVAKGARRSQADCAAARSIKRCLPEAVGARVCRSRVYVEYPDHWEMYTTPAHLRNEIIVHDRDGKFNPGDYYLRPITPSERARIGKRQGSDKPGARDRGSRDRTPKRPRATPHIVQGIRARGANV